MAVAGPISLYFGLKEGRNADLEIVAQAALHWVEAVRAAARRIDPEARVRVELVDASEGSLRLNAILDWAESQLSQIDEGSRKYWRLRRLAVALAIFIPVSGIPTYDFYFGDHSMHLSEEDKNLLLELLKQTSDQSEVKESGRRFFKTLEHDPAIKSVGIAEDRNGSPTALVPDTAFAERGGLWTLVEDETDRTLYSVMDVILVSPTLSHRPRPWVFQQEGMPEFSAVMKDLQFLTALDQAHVREQLRTGIRMTIRLEIRERKIEGDWVLKRRGRSVIEVLSPRVD